MEIIISGLAILLSIAVCLIIAVNIGIFIFVQDIKLFTTDSPLAFAFLVLMVMSVFIIVNVLKETKEIKRSFRSVQVLDKRKGLIEIGVVILYMAVTLVYVYLLRYLHFIFGTFLFMGIGMFLLNETKMSVKKKLIRVLLAVTITVPVLYGIFEVVFSVMLP